MLGQDIHATLARMEQIRESVTSGQRELDALQKSIHDHLSDGASTGDPILDIVLEFDPSFQTGNLEQNLRELDQRIRECPDQMILVNQIRGFNRYNIFRGYMPIVGLLTTENPSIRSAGELNGIEIRTKGEQPIILPRAALVALTKLKTPFNIIPTDWEYAIQLYIGYEAINKHLVDMSAQPKYSLRTVIRFHEAIKKLVRIHDISFSENDPLKNMRAEIRTA